MAENFGIGGMGLGPLAGMAETMEFVKRAWSSFNLPSSMAPTLDLDEIDKRIADLRTVEQWLSLNLGMLQSAIQGLEIQRGTLAAIMSFGEAMAAPGALDAGAAAKAMAAMASTSASPGAAGASSQVPGTAAGGGGEPGRPAAVNEAPGQAAADRDPAAAGRPFGLPDTASINPAAWWNLLQSQFSQVAQAALAGAVAGMPATATSTATRVPPAGAPGEPSVRATKKPRQPGTAPRAPRKAPARPGKGGR